MKQLIVRLVLMATLSIALSSCRSDDDTTRTPQAAGEVVITMAGFPAFQQTYETLAQQFQELHPEIEIEFVALDEQTARLTPRELASLADVLLMDRQLPAGASAAFLDLGPFVAADPGFDAQDFWPGILDACQIDGVQAGLPLQASASLIMFDKRAFDAGGLPYPEPGWDWAAFQQAAQVLTRRTDGETTRYGFLDSGRSLLLLAPLVDAMVTQSGYQPGQLAERLDWYIALADQGAIPTPTGGAVEDAQRQNALIQNRLAAMWISSQGQLSEWQALLGEDLGVVSFPTAAPTTHSNTVNVGCVVVSAGAAQAAAAWLWVDFLTAQAPEALGSQQAAPARKSVAESSGYWRNMDGGAAGAIRYALEHGWYSRDPMPEIAAAGEALIETLSGQGTLAGNLPLTVEAQHAGSTASDGAPIVVATSSAATSAATIDYYAPPYVHSSPEAVRILAKTFNESQDRIQVNVLSGAFGPTEVVEQADCFARFGNAGSLSVDQLYSLSPLFDAEDASFQGDFAVEQLAVNQVNGQLYGLPVAVQPFVVQYNADLFAELALDPPSMDWTVDDFWTIAEAATRNAGDQKIFGFAPNQLFPENLLLFAPDAAPFYDLEEALPGPAFTEPAVVQALTWLAGMVEAGVMVPIEPLGTQAFSSFNNQARQEEVNLIEQGRVAMWVDLAGSHHSSLNVGEAPYPLTELQLLSGQAHTTTILQISRRAADPAGCWAWLKFLSAQPDAFPGIPVRRSILESPEWTAVVGQEAAAAYQAMAARPLLILSGDPRILEQSRITFPYNFWWADALRRALAGDDPATALEDVQRRAEAYLTCIIALDGGISDLNQSMACAREGDPEFAR